MTRFRLYLFTTAVMLSAFVMRAQDIHFSQFYLSPLNLNPAMTGVMNCNIRMVANYRNQWASVLKSNAFSTYSASYDQRIPVGRYDYFGVGGTLWGDRAGSANFAQTQARISGSYSKRMGGYRDQANYLVAGIDLGVTQRSIDFLKLQWGSQNNEGVYNPDAASNEPSARDNLIYPDLSAGILWFGVKDENTNYYVGASYNHLNRPNISFYSKDVSLYSRFVAHAGGEFMLNNTVGLVPNLVIMKQGPSLLMNPGTSLKFVLSKSRYEYQAFQIGTWVRVANKTPSGFLVDAAILTTRFDYNNMTLGFSYDLNASKLKSVTNGNGAFEFALIYKICGQENRDIYCPNF